MYCRMAALSSRRAGYPDANSRPVNLTGQWTIVSLLPFVPFLSHGMDVINALPESFSAWTDTGLTMVPEPQALPLSLSVFRILMQWASGLRIVILMLFLYTSLPRSTEPLSGGGTVRGLYDQYLAAGPDDHPDLRRLYRGRLPGLVGPGLIVVRCPRARDHTLIHRWPSNEQDRRRIRRAPVSGGHSAAAWSSCCSGTARCTRSLPCSLHRAMSACTRCPSCCTAECTQYPKFRSDHHP